MITALDVRVYRVPLDEPESDGTIEWDATTAIVVRVATKDAQGLGYTYGVPAVARVIRDELRERVIGRDPHAIPAIVADLARSLRNAGRDGIGSMAISAIDVALWDLKARLLDVSLARLLGLARNTVPIYGSGGFTSMSNEALENQLSKWQSSGFSRVKMKVGREPKADAERVQRARAAIGNDCELFVDANGAFSPREALRFAHRIEPYGVSCFEEPVSSDDVEGLRFVRNHASMAIAAGEYAWDVRAFDRLLDAVDVIQADATRIGGVSGFLAAAHIADGHQVPLSSHCAPSIHVHLCAAAPRLAHLEYFADHARAERLLFDGVVDPVGGALAPDTRPGLGLSLSREAERFLEAKA